MEKPVRILATGKYLPKKVDSADIEREFNIPSGWSIKNSGVNSRHRVTFESNGYMGARAVEDAMKHTTLTMKDIDLLIYAGATYDHPLPSQASVIKAELKPEFRTTMGTMDIDSTCLSFVCAFEVAAKLLDGKQYRNIIIVSSEISSKCLNPRNYETQTLFGDGAAAVVLSYDESSGSRFIKGGQLTFSEGVEYTIIRGGGVKYFFKDYPYKPEFYSFDMQGIKLLKLAKSKIPVFMDWFFQDLSLTLTDIDVIIPHQASKMGLTVFKNLYAFKAGQVKENLYEKGNCVSVSIPLLLDEVLCRNEIKRGDYCMLTGTSAGFSIGGVLIRY